MKHNWTFIKDFIKSHANDTVVTIDLPKKLQHLLEDNPEMPSSIQVRLLKKKRRNGEVQVFCCSLTDQKNYSRKSILNLYKQRWGIEEAYKLLKCRLEVADFSGLTAQAIQQDFYAKTMLLSLGNLICYDLKPDPPKRQPIKRNKEERTPIINRTDALHAIKKNLAKIAFEFDKELFLKWLKTLEDRLKKRPTYSRKNQFYERKPSKDVKYSSNYKFA